MHSEKGRTYFYLALLIGVLLHGVLVFTTFERTYDAYVHIFFASHYADSWFDHWDYKWYTGFSMVSYPPLIHQVIALFSLIVDLKAGFLIISIVTILIFIRGVYQFSKLWVSPEIAGLASILAVVCTSFIEALHVFGQLPSLFGVGVLLNATPYVYRWIRNKRLKDLGLSLLFFAVITSAHHVTTIFGVVFFIFPVIGLALMDNAIDDVGGEEHVGIRDFIKHFKKIFWPALIFGVMILVVTVTMIFPYWVWSSSDPITQVPIPHGSRDSFIEVFSSALVFFLIPWALVLFCLPFIFKHVYRKRNIILGLSFTLAFVLGTGGTTFIPKAILGENAFNILTLDRFTYWATIMALPFFGAFIHSLLFGKFGTFILAKVGTLFHRLYIAIWVIGILISAGFIINLGHFQPNQPEKIEIKPIQNFLKRDQHDEWRYLTLGFGDQVAWLSANTTALTVDGNYHSVRRLPEMTTRKVERLENAKYQGTQGIGALQQFLVVPEKYNLKYIFSNDKFYDPILYFSGWQRLKPLENNIEVWERPDIPSLPTVLPRKEIPRYQQLMWSILPISSLILLFVIWIFVRFGRGVRKTADVSESTIAKLRVAQNSGGWIDLIWSIILLIGFVGFMTIKSEQNELRSTPESLVTAYFDAIDYQEFKRAFSYYNPNTSPSIDQMMLDLSQEDGITSSFAKLSGLSTKTSYDDTKNSAKVVVKADWLTSINTFTSYHNFDLTKGRNGWMIDYALREVITPPDQIFSTPKLEFKDQGRRDALTTGTVHQDVMDRPEVYIEEANLVKYGDEYHIVGLIKNIDNDPSYTTITGVLYDERGHEIVRYNAKEIMVHHLLPKESSYFRIDFEEMMYQISMHTMPDTFDPEFSNPYSFDKTPYTFRVFVKSLVTTEYLYKYFGINDLKYTEGGTITGSFINTGTQECSIPQLISGYRDNDALVWVDSEYLAKAIRPQRSKRFQIELPDISKLSLIEKGNNEYLFVNGITNQEFNRPEILKGNGKNKSLFRINDTLRIEVTPTGYMNK